MALLELTQKYGLVPKGSTKYSGCICGKEQYTQFMAELGVIGMPFATCNSKLGKSGTVLFNLKTAAFDSYTGRPFQVQKTTSFVCSMGGPCRKFCEQSENPDQTPKRKKQVFVRPTKKIGCPATMAVKCIKIFDEDCYKAKAPRYKAGSQELRQISRKLKARMRSSSPPTTQLQYIIEISSESEHTHTTVATNLNGILHPSLLEEIHKVVDNNICSVKTMRIHLNGVVRRMFNDDDRPKPDTLNRMFYPTDKVIRNHMYKALYSSKKIKYDQDAMAACIPTWQANCPDDRFFFRPYGPAGGDDDDGDSCRTILFCHQTKWQRDLLARYGNHVSLLDPTYKTTKYDLPLFFVLVKTNSGYCVVGTFVVQSESKVLIAEALARFRAWNPDWEPKYFMTDHSDAEMCALGETFPRATVYLCAFHRERAWDRWLMRRGHVAKAAVGPLGKLWRDIAGSRTHEEFLQNVAKMEYNAFYKKNQLAEQYFAKEWLPISYRWVAAYLATDFLAKVNTNDGVEGQDKVLKHAYLKKNKDNTLTGLIRTLTKSFLPGVVREYSAANATDPENLNGDVAEFLGDRPAAFVRHVVERLARGRDYDASQIADIGGGQFCVESARNPHERYNVDFQEANCTCADFARWRFPCKHMCAVFAHTRWGFDKLPVSYRESPYLTLDKQYSGGVAPTNTTALETDHDYQLTTASPPTVDHDDDDDDDEPVDEPIDDKKDRRKLQQHLKTITCYSYLQFTPENLKKFVDMSEQFEGAAKSLVTTSDEGLLMRREATPPHVASKGLQRVKTKKRKYKDI